MNLFTKEGAKMTDYGNLMMLAGIYLSRPGNEFVSSIELQKEMSLLGAGGYNPPLSDCKIALEKLYIGGFLDEIGGIYSKKHSVKPEVKEHTHAEKIGINSLQNPLWSGNI